jgi:hypothetical protein
MVDVRVWEASARLPARCVSDFAFHIPQSAGAFFCEGPSSALLLSWLSTGIDLLPVGVDDSHLRIPLAQQLGQFEGSLSLAEFDPLDFALLFPAVDTTTYLVLAAESLARAVCLGILSSQCSRAINSAHSSLVVDVYWAARLTTKRRTF